MQKTVDAFAEHGMITSRIDVKSSGLFDYGLVDRYNDFDVEAVKNEARQWKG